MLSFSTVHALTTCLLHAEGEAPSGTATAQWLGTLVLAQDHPVGPATSRLRHLRLLHLPLSGQHHQQHSLPAALDQIADALCRRDPSPGDRSSPGAGGPLHPGELDVLRAALHQPGMRLLAWAVRYDDVLADDEHLATVQRVEAVDVDGRVYQLSRPPGEPHPVGLLDEQPDPADLPATHPPLARLATAAQPAQT